ncbi:peptidoglycan D,D-transpeptidase FtsI family protein [Specibacter sp. RAF43]|uniref:peptidoglycan D,D-transpeptidase FtsI family protein n=1 Tax=Specibacter sp. RAF43 TaxID=3233057 RepID=UPI003F99512C
MAHDSKNAARDAPAQHSNTNQRFNDSLQLNKIGRKRMRIGFVVMLAFLAVIAGKLFMIQGLDVGKMAEAAEHQRTVVQVLPAVRGKIVDAKGRVLAESVVRYDITVSQLNNTAATSFKHYEANQATPVVYTRDEGLAQLAKALSMPFAAVKKAATGSKDFNYIARNVTPEVEGKVSALRIPGIYPQATTKRVYPIGQVGGTVVGFLGSDGKGLSGIEQTMNDKLTGKDGSRTFQAGKNGIIIPTAPVRTIPSVNGQTVKLTIDQDIQYYAQQAAQQQKSQYNAQWVNITIIEAKTGRLIALADTDAPDPNNPGATDARNLGSRTVTAAVEPGSTDKIMTAAAVIEEGLMTPMTHVLVPPTYTVDGQNFSDAFPHGVEKRTLAGIIGDSLNTGTVMAGEKLTPEQRYDYLRKFGIGEKTGIPLPGESPGILADWRKWDGRQQYTVLFGQGVAQTPLQTAFIYQTIANDGVRLAPRLIDAFVDPDGTEHLVKAAPGIKVISPKTAQDSRDMLESVTTVADAKDVKIPGYRVGGKTGTAESPADNGRGFDGYTSSFIGMAPMDDPQYVVAITVQRPQGLIYGVTQGYTFNDVMGQVLHTYNVPPSTTPVVKLPQYYQ